MHRLATAALVAACAMLVAPWAPARTNALTLEEALALARERGPRLLAAGLRVDEARGRLAGASLLLRENPVLEAGAGRRYAGDGDSPAASLGLHQTFELGGQRRARIAGAEAGIEGASAARDDALRRLLREVAVAFWGVLYAEQSLRVADRAEEVADEVAHSAERRHRAEEVPVLDVNVSRAALARARSESRVAEAALVSASGELRILLGMDGEEPLAATGELRDRRRFVLPQLLGRVSERADLRALEAKLERAEADVRLARGRAWPDLGLGGRYERDEGDDVFLGELSLALPIFDRAQGPRAEASARARRLRLELDAARRAARAELQTAFAVHSQRARAVEELEERALPLLDANESLARRSYEAGEMALAELLLIRRETLETRSEYLERLLEAALAAVEVEASAGVLE